MGDTQDVKRKFDFDELAWKLADHLLEDFKPFVSSSFYNTAIAASAARNVVGWRALSCGNFDDYQPYQLKTSYQVVSLFKKFSFSQDLYTPADLQRLSTEKFMENQQRLLNHVFPDDPRLNSIIFGARGYVDKILGDFSSLEICERATFGKKSSVGIPMRHACEGARYEAPITGSQSHIDWFDKYYGAWNRPAHIYAQSRAALIQKPPYRLVKLLEAVLVDKTWKSLRMIMPNTTIGTLYSSGLGRTIEDRLRSFGYDIKYLQPVHGELAKIGSITGSLVTGDQSMASDNITTKLIDLICSRQWASALKFGRIEEIALNGKEIVTPTFSTMGIGFTFPLQTLVFLAILLSIRDYCQLDEQTVVSVFGDDLIYDVRMHQTVSEVFPQLGLLMNADKTFSEGGFRESCGYDYFRGIDVRPYLLGRAKYRSAGKRRVEAYLYTVLNGLLLRWEVYEIPTTLAFLVEEIRQCRGNDPLIVPPDYPDTAGVKCSLDVAMLLGISTKVKRGSDGFLHFRYLAFESDLRQEERHVPYLLRELSKPSTVDCSLTPFFPKKGNGCMLEERTDTFTRVDDPQGRSVRSEMSGRRYRPQLTMIPEQDSGRYRERSGVTGNWTPVNRTRATKPSLFGG